VTAGEPTCEGGHWPLGEYGPICPSCVSDAARVVDLAAGQVADAVAALRAERYGSVSLPMEVQRCEPGWTFDRCRFPFGHDGPHDNEEDGTAALIAALEAEGMTTSDAQAVLDAELFTRERSR
jgi:hypothetical protein